MKDKRLILMIFSIFMLFMIVFGASYSYFIAQGVGSGDDRQATITVGKLELKYTDGLEYLKTTGDWEPGDYVTKTFTVTNNSSTTAYYRIYMDDVVNTFVMQKQDKDGNVINDEPYELIYTLKKNDIVVINEASNIPVLSDAGIIYGKEGLGIEIAKDSIDTYELTIKFIDTGENQNYNQSKVFSTKITLKEPSFLYRLFTNLITERNDLIYDDFGNIRFVGSDANNYIIFNNEEWRIIGLFKDIEQLNEHGEYEKNYLLKIVKNGTIRTKYDTKGTYGSNNWTNADLMYLLNGDYLNNEGTYTQSSTIKSLSNVVNKIATVKWNLGGYNVNSIIPKDSYKKERGTLGGKSNPSVISWEGKVALMYPSDYGYSTTGEVILNYDTGEKTNCLNTNMNIWNSNGCASKSWLYNSKINQTFLTPSTQLGNSLYCLFTSGNLGIISADNSGNYIRPTLYLNSNIKLIGTGEQGANAFRIVE